MAPPFSGLNCCLIHANYLLCILFRPQNWGNIFFRNVDGRSVARQRTDKHSVAKLRNNRTAVLRKPFLGNGSINTLPRIRSNMGRCVFFVVRAEALSWRQLGRSRNLVVGSCESCVVSCDRKGLQTLNTPQHVDFHLILSQTIELFLAVRSSLNVTDQISHPYTSTDRITELYVSIFRS
jgi:hypothetical protein